MEGPVDIALEMSKHLQWYPPFQEVVSLSFLAKYKWIEKGVTYFENLLCSKILNASTKRGLIQVQTHHPHQPRGPQCVL